jgi:hypothetical protein
MPAFCALSSFNWTRILAKGINFIWRIMGGTMDISWLIVPSVISDSVNDVPATIRSGIPESCSAAGLSEEPAGSVQEFKVAIKARAARDSRKLLKRFINTPYIFLLKRTIDFIKSFQN